MFGGFWWFFERGILVGFVWLIWFWAFWHCFFFCLDFLFVCFGGIVLVFRLFCCRIWVWYFWRRLFFVFICLFVEIEGKMISQQHGLVKERVEAKAVKEVTKFIPDT